MSKFEIGQCFTRASATLHNQEAEAKRNQATTAGTGSRFNAQLHAADSSPFGGNK